MQAAGVRALPLTPVTSETTSNGNSVPAALLARAQARPAAATRRVLTAHRARPGVPAHPAAPRVQVTRPRVPVGVRVPARVAQVIAAAALRAPVRTVLLRAPAARLTAAPAPAARGVQARPALVTALQAARGVRVPAAVPAALALRVAPGVQAAQAAQAVTPAQAAHLVPQVAVHQAPGVRHPAVVQARPAPTRM